MHNIIKCVLRRFITTTYNLYSYMFPTFSCHHQSVYVCSSPNYSSLPNSSCWKYNFI